MRRVVLVVVALLSIAPPAVAGTGGTSPGGGGSAARLQGTWTMSGKVTRADGVRGERKGQKLTRRWTFTSTCTSGPCSTVALRRERSNHQVDKLTLKRSGSSYAGSGKFYVRLKCNGHTYNRGGIAYYTIRVSATRTRTVQGTAFATRVSASYNNTKRVNKTPCGGSIGRDAGTYSGKLTSEFPAAPTADFEFANGSTPLSVDFADKSTRAKSARFVSWRWNFGDNAKSSEKNPSHTYTAPGTYTVTLTVRDTNGLTSTATKQVTV